jgi:ribosome recycling factor
MLKEIIIKTEELMKKSVEKFKETIKTIRTGRANVSIVENIKVECYNSVSLLNKVAGITIPDSRTIEIRPWDATILPAIEKAIYQADIGLTPVNDGKVIRLTVPPLTEERRKELVKYLHKVAEEFHISIRNERHNGINLLKKAEKDKKISKDDYYKGEQQLQKLTDIYLKNINEILAIKEKEIMTE